MKLEIDQAHSQIRKGEELNVEKLTAYLDHFFKTKKELTISQFPGGHSNLTYLIGYGEEEYVLRKPPHGAKAIKGGHDMSREFKMLSFLRPVYGRVPRPVLYCEEEEVLGMPFYLMERVKGIILRSKKPDGIELTPALMRHLSETFISNFVLLQRVDVHQSGLISLGKPEGYVQRQIEGTLQRYQNVALEPIPEVAEVGEWLLRNIPDEKSVSVIHNDYKFDNVVYDADGMRDIVAVLDWEMSTVGNPLMDLGMLLAYWVEPGEPNFLNTFATSMLGSFNREEVLAYYEEKSQKKVKDIVFYYAYACLKNGVVAQQLYYRYAKGFTQDERLGKIGPFVRGFFQYALNVIKAGRISRI